MNSFSNNIHTHPKPRQKTSYTTFPGIPQLGARLPSRRQETWVPVLISSQEKTTIQGDNADTGSALGKIALSRFQNCLRTTISKFIDHRPPLDPSVDPCQVFTGNFAPVDELEPTNCTVVEATHCSRYVKTYKYMLEKEAGLPIFPNILSGFYSLPDVLAFVMAVGRVLCGQINLTRGFGLANTSLALISSKLLALCESDLPYVIRMTQEGDIETQGRWDFDRKLFASMTAHPKLVVEPANVVLGRGMPVVCEQKKVPRIGILPRYAESDSNTRWFPVPGFNAMHVTNAWENGDDEVVLVAPNVLSIANVFHRIEKVHFSLEKLTINTRTGKVSRKILSERSLELGSINPSYIGKKNRYAYLGIAEKVPKMSGLAKIDLEKECEVSRRLYGPGCFGGEPLFVPRKANDVKSDEDEDDGFVVSYVHDENSGQSNIKNILIYF
ncbi:zeaxanthin 7,8(7',8')-cleavage dioxygenase [Populus alba x Populus x berolinensis]|nr:zeaxanthin 7,8(7',8')-cleavage dioxygenase [Populus alba x Populus x berolinensis]